MDSQITRIRVRITTITITIIRTAIMIEMIIRMHMETKKLHLYSAHVLFKWSLENV